VEDYIQKKYVHSELGFAIDRPYKGWTEYERKTGPELQIFLHGPKHYELMKKNYPKLINLMDKSDVIWTRRGGKKIIKIKPGSIMDNNKITDEIYNRAKISGIETVGFFNNFSIATFKKESFTNWKKKNIWNLFMAYFQGFEGNIGNLVYEPQNRSILIESLREYRNVIIEDKDIDYCRFENRLAFFESSDKLYLVDISFLDSGIEPKEIIWKELNNYLKSFRIIEYNR
jgi:hypothetical protein